MNKVFETAFRGCGLSFSWVKRSQPYRQYLARQKQLTAEYSEGSQRGIALRAGTLDWGQRLYVGNNERKALELSLPNGTIPPINAELRTNLFLLGTAMVNKAAARLPKDARELADKCKDASSKDQIGILQELSQCVLKSSRQDSFWALRHNQGNERAFPTGYGFTSKKAKPNCLGYASLVAGFAKRARLKAIAVTPLMYAESCYNQARYKIAKKLLANSKSGVFKPSKAFRSYLKKVIAHVERAGGLFQVSHNAILVRLRDYSWVLVDPYYGVISNQLDQGDIRNKARLLEKYALVTPGISLYGKSKSVQSHLDKYLEGYDLCFKAGIQYEKRSSKKNFGIGRAAQALNSLDEKTRSILLESVFPEELQDFLRYAGLKTMDPTDVFLSFCLNEVKDLKFKHFEGDKINKNLALQRRINNNSEARKIARTLSNQIHAASIKALDLHWRTRCSFYAHPHFEVSGLEYSLASALVRMVSINGNCWRHMTLPLAEEFFGMDTLHNHILRLQGVNTEAQSERMLRPFWAAKSLPVCSGPASRIIKELSPALEHRNPVTI